MFYILPDYSVEKDSTNLLIRESISDKAFNATLLSKISASSGYPNIVEIESEDATTTSKPTVDMASASVSLTSITVNAILKEVKGYIVVGIISGKKSSSPSIDLLK